MPSHSLTKWNAERAEALDKIEDAHATVGSTERGRRYATQQINYSYTALLSSHFQGFCRDLHSESMLRPEEVPRCTSRGSKRGAVH